MPQQRRLPFPEETALEDLWEHFPEANRQELVALYARWLAQLAIELSRPARGKERVDEKTCG